MCDDRFIRYVCSFLEVFIWPKTFVGVLNVLLLNVVFTVLNDCMPYKTLFDEMTEEERVANVEIEFDKEPSYGLFNVLFLVTAIVVISFFCGFGMLKHKVMIPTLIY